MGEGETVSRMKAQSKGQGSQAKGSGASTEPRGGEDNKTMH